MSLWGCQCPYCSRAYCLGNIVPSFCLPRFTFVCLYLPFHSCSLCALPSPPLSLPLSARLWLWIGAQGDNRPYPLPTCHLTPNRGELHTMHGSTLSLKCTQDVPKVKEPSGRVGSKLPTPLSVTEGKASGICGSQRKSEMPRMGPCPFLDLALLFF